MTDIPTHQFYKFSGLINKLQSAAYDTGWYSGAIEHGRKDLADAQRHALYVRQEAKKELLDEILKVVDGK